MFEYLDLLSKDFDGQTITMKPIFNYSWNARFPYKNHLGHWQRKRFFPAIVEKDGTTNVKLLAISSNTLESKFNIKSNVGYHKITIGLERETETGHNFRSFKLISKEEVAPDEEMEDREFIDLVFKDNIDVLKQDIYNQILNVQRNHDSKKLDECIKLNQELLETELEL